VACVTCAAGAIGVASIIRVDAVFSEDVDATTLTNKFILVRQGTTTPIAATLSYNTATRTASLQPSTSRNPNIVYTATVKGGASTVIVR